MKKAEIKIGGYYQAKISNRLTIVRIDSKTLHGNGWMVTNMNTNRQIRIRSAAKLRREMQWPPQ